MARDVENEDDIERRRNRRRAGRSSEQNLDAPTEPSGSSSEPSGEGFDRDTGLARTLETGQMISRGHFKDENEWMEYFAKVPQEIKRAHRENARANQERVYAGLADGMSLADMGITNEKDHGQALYRRLTSLGLLDPNWEYNWDTGMKRNVGTSDAGARNRYERISESEMRERAEQQRYGGDFAARIRDDAQNRMNAAVRNGTFTRDQNGLLYNDPQNDASRRQYYDDSGYFIDPTTRQRTGGGHSGFVWGAGRQTGAGNFTGVGGSWGAGSQPVAPGPVKPPPQPYYRNRANTFGNPNSGNPWQKKKTFGAPM